jgi:hypothetical protein
LMHDGGQVFLLRRPSQCFQTRAASGFKQWALWLSLS